MGCNIFRTKKLGKNLDKKHEFYYLKNEGEKFLIHYEKQKDYNSNSTKAGATKQKNYHSTYRRI